MRVKLPGLVALLVLPLIATGCSNGASADNPTATPTPSATASPTPAPIPTPTTDPLTGLGRVAGPVVAVKVDNGVLARPYQRGLKQAAVIYQELVEGGATRFMAVFESASATSEVGPIRSARESDLSILRAYGRPSLAFSGAQNGVFALVRKAARNGQVIDASYDTVPGLYRLGERRRDARNFFAVPAEVGKRRGGSQPRDIGFVFGPAGVGTPTATARTVFSPYTTMKARYQPKTGTWVISEHGRVVPVAPANVVIQYVTVKRSRFYDVNGMNSPLTVTTGNGKVVVLRDGKRFPGTWKRAAGYGVTRFRDAAGKQIPLKPGATWVMLVPRTAGVSYS